jgi:hypothetical protein
MDEQGAPERVRVDADDVVAVRWLVRGAITVAIQIASGLTISASAGGIEPGTTKYNSAITVQARSEVDRDVDDLNAESRADHGVAGLVGSDVSSQSRRAEFVPCDWVRAELQLGDRLVRHAERRCDRVYSALARSFRLVHGLR